MLLLSQQLKYSNGSYSFNSKEIEKHLRRSKREVLRNNFMETGKNEEKKQELETVIG